MAVPVAAQDPVPFTCTGQAFIVFDPASQLNQVDLFPGESPGFTFNIIANPINGLQINNLGYRSTDGLLYGWERNAADNAGQIVQIDSTGAVIGLGNPGLPSNQGNAFNYNAGDVSVDGSKMYLSYSQTNGSGGLLYVVDLPALTLSTVNITGDSGGVADWAAHPTDGLLYGGDHTTWQLAILDPATGVRTDVNISLPNEGSKGYGAAWFDATGRLYLYHNSGKIYAVDNVDTTPTLVGGSYPLLNSALNTSNNDGANCAAGVQEDVVIEKTLVSGPEEIGIYLPAFTVYVFEIAYSGPAAKVIDTVPAEFEIISVVPSAGTAVSFRTGQGGTKGASRIEWDAPAGSNTLTVTIWTVASPGKGHKDPVLVFKPTSCGPLPLNDGATAFEVDEFGNLVLVEVVDPDTGEITLEPVVIVGPSNPLVVEAVAGDKPCEEEDEDDD
jgi:hypothetical protein